MQMLTLQDQMTHDYAQHPGFKFDQFSLVAPQDKLSNFNGVYETLMGHACFLGAKQFNLLRAECFRNLGAIFSELSLQTHDAFELQFLDELGSECRRLLSERLVHHRWKLSLQGISLENYATRQKLSSLEKNRHFLGALEADAVSKILELGASDLEAFRESARQGKTTREDLSRNVGKPIREIVRVLNREYQKQGVLDALGAYMHRRMLVVGLALELSVPQANWWSNSFEKLSRAPQTLYAHLDESIEFPKSIVYLSDVDQATGPTSFYPGIYEELTLTPIQELVGRIVGNVGNGPTSQLKSYYSKRYHQSMSSETFRRHFMRLPEEMRFNSHFGWDVCPGSEAEKKMLAREQFLIGKAGAYIVFDGARLLHRGGLIQRGERIVLQVVFSSSSLLRRVASKIKRAIV